MSIKIEKEDLANGLMSLIDASVKNRKDLVKFLSELIIENDRATEHFIKFSLGSKYPVLPYKGDMGYIKLSEQGYTFSTSVKEMLENSDLNHHGFIPCKVVSMGAIHLYSPLVVEITLPDEDKSVITINTDYARFYPIEGTDIYDDLPI